MRLIDCFIDLMAYVAYVTSEGAPTDLPFEDVQGTINMLIKNAEKLRDEGRILRDDFENSLFAICAWVDERMMASSWLHKAEWQKHPLQVIHFKTGSAGVEFFRRLRELDFDKDQVREIYFVCQELGFLGQYCRPNQRSQLDGIITSNLKALIGSSTDLSAIANDKLFPAIYEQGGKLNVSLKEDVGRSKRRTLMLYGAPLALYLILLLIFTFVLNSQLGLIEW